MPSLWVRDFAFWITVILIEFLSSLLQYIRNPSRKSHCQKWRILTLVE